MTEEERSLTENTGPVVEPDEVIRPGQIPRSRTDSGIRPSGIYIHRTSHERASIIPGVFGAMIGMVLGAVIGAVIGFLAGPAGTLVGVGIGALGGFVMGALIASAVWLLIPKFIRILIALAITYVVLNWLSWKFLGMPLLQWVTQQL